MLSGQIVFDDAAPPFAGATIHVRVEDVSRADAASIEAARLDLPGVSHAPGQPPLEFAVDAGELDGAARYEVRVHVDMDGSGVMKAGDQISMTSIPVLTRGSPDRVRVQVRSIR